MKVLEQLGYKPRVPVPARDFADPVKRESWIREKFMIVFQLDGPSKDEVPVDIFVTEPFDFDAEWQRAEKMPVGKSGLTMPVVSYSQLIALKRASGRGTDLIDIENLERIRQYKRNE